MDKKTIKKYRQQCKFKTGEVKENSKLLACSKIDKFEAYNRLVGLLLVNFIK